MSKVTKEDVAKCLTPYLRAKFSKRAGYILSNVAKINTWNLQNIAENEFIQEDLSEKVGLCEQMFGFPYVALMGVYGQLIGDSNIFDLFNDGPRCHKTHRVIRISKNINKLAQIAISNNFCLKDEDFADYLDYRLDVNSLEVESISKNKRFCKEIANVINMVTDTLLDVTVLLDYPHDYVTSLGNTSLKKLILFVGFTCIYLRPFTKIFADNNGDKEGTGLTPEFYYSLEFNLDYSLREVYKVINEWFKDQEFFVSCEEFCFDSIENVASACSFLQSK